MVKKVLLTGVVFVLGAALICPRIASAYNFGDYRSTTLISKAWKALEDKDLEAVLAYTNKCVELYASKAGDMQAALTDYPVGTNDEIFAYWALNDVATGYFIQGKAYQDAGMSEEAVKAYQTVVDKYSYGQTWDLKGWFWKPSETAVEKIAMIESGSMLDFGDYTSVTLTTKAWQALAADDIEAVEAYTSKCLELYESEAKRMQESLAEYAWESKEEIFKYWALNDVGTSLFIQGEIFRKAGRPEDAKVAYKRLIDEYYYSQCWDPKGWFWKPSEAAQQKLDELNEG